MDTPRPARMLFVDNLRLAIITLVLCVHAAVTYSGLGSWYHKESLPLDTASRLFFICFQGYSQAFFMGTLFALAGYFAAASLKKKGPRAFVQGRAFRLGLPSLLYMLAINPFVIYWLAGHGERSAEGFFEYLGRYLSSGRFIGGSGPMWFAVALLIFCLAYAAAWALRRDPEREKDKRPLSWRFALGLILVCAVGTYAVRIVLPVGTSFLNMQLCFFTQYVVLFLFGLAAHGNDWLRTLPARFGRPCLALSLAGLPVLAAFIHWGGGLGKDLPEFLGGGHWKSLAFAFWEATIGVCMTLGLMWLCREKWNAQGALTRTLSDGAFAVYVFHPPILVSMSLLLAPLTLAAVPKFLALCAAAIPVSFAAGFGLRRVPVLRDMLTS
ncbi:MAG: acyltransferase family protein [Desulfovibrionaceae bacterium]|nr:acyltransferase family protein [Desulfovibrionaceae bacterium]